ncbi:MAG: hypothetical protein GY732_13660 [Gammaproteobacteria bacterium]|nr:hypothetical protein [Gammaproteobacteria bacterium]
MQDRKQVSVEIRTGSKIGIWLALLVALGIHVIIVFLPLSRQSVVSEPPAAQIEVQLTTFTTQPELQQTEIAVEPNQPEIQPEPETDPEPEPIENVAEAKPTQQLPRPQPPVMALIPQPPDLNDRLESMDELEKRELTNSILTRQFITEESVTDRLFGKQAPQQPAEFQKEFHYPVRQSMITMLDQPMQELPFAFTPGLIHFAYDPGVKGDLQRFWDVITPEFGWRTQYGTEVRCIWMLVIVGCGWK